MNVDSFNINDSVTSIGSEAFKGCIALSCINSSNDGEFIINNNIQSIGYEAFNGCIKLKSITLPFVGLSKTETGSAGLFGDIFGSTEYTGGTSVKQNYGDGSRTYYIPEQLKTVTITNAIELSYGAFYNCSILEKIVINSGVKSNIGKEAFYNCVQPSYN